MGDTVYGRLVELKKKQLTADLVNSTNKERDELRAKIDLIDVSLVGKDGERYLMDTSNAVKDGDKGSE